MIKEKDYNAHRAVPKPALCLYELNLFFLLLFFQELGERGGDGSCGSGSSFEVQAQSQVFYRFGSGGTITADGYFALFEVGIFLQQGLYAYGGEEYQHVVAQAIDVTDVVCHSAIHHGFRISQIVRADLLGYLIRVRFGLRYEVMLRTMLRHHGKQVCEFSRFAKKHFSLSVLYIFLYVECNGFRCTEILHCFGDAYTQVFAKSEEMVYGMPGVEDNGSMVQYGNFLLSELFCCQAFYFDERMKVYLYTKLFCNIEIRRPLSGRLWLGYEYLLYFQWF